MVGDVVIEGLGSGSKSIRVSIDGLSNIALSIGDARFIPLKGQLDRICSICCNPDRLPEDFTGWVGLAYFSWSSSRSVLYVEISHGIKRQKVKLSSDSAMRLRWTLEKLGGVR